METRCRTTPRFGAAACVVLGMGIALLGATAKAQVPGPSAAAEADRGTAQPPGPPDLDANFWSLVRDSGDPDALQSYLASFPTGKFADQARQRIASLKEQGKVAKAMLPPSPSESDNKVELARTTPSPAPQIAPPATGNADLARSLQRELKRVGCLNAEADGVWGDKSRTALRNFVRHANVGVGGDEPSAAALDAASAKQARVCPLVCDDGEKLVGDRCVAVAKPRPVAKPEQPRRAWAERPAPQARESGSGNPNSGKRLCFGGGRNELVTCP